MARETFVFRDGKVVEKHLARPLHEGDATFHVISDTMAPIRSMADGKMYDSKSRYVQGVRDKGCYIVGNDRMDRSTTALPSAGATIKRSIEQLRSR